MTKEGKVCNDCEESLTEENWFPSFRKSYSYLCKTCSRKRLRNNRGKRKEHYRAKAKVYRESRKEAAKCRRLQVTYGLTLSDWKKIFKGQGESCAICDTKEEPSMGWHTDHCHTTGKVRGVLCHGCNTGLGKFKDNPNILIKAAKYLEENK